MKQVFPLEKMCLLLFLNIHIRAQKRVDHVKVYNILGEMLIQANPGKQEFELQTNHITPGHILIINAFMEDG